MTRSGAKGAPEAAEGKFQQAFGHRHDQDEDGADGERPARRRSSRRRGPAKER